MYYVQISKQFRLTRNKIHQIQLRITDINVNAITPAKYLPDFDGFVPKRIGLAGAYPEIRKGGRNLKLFVFPPKSSEKQKEKDHHALKLSFIRMSPLHHENFVPPAPLPRYTPDLTQRFRLQDAYQLCT